jgi:Glycosyltransferase family 87
MRVTISQRRFEQLVSLIAAAAAVVIALGAPGFGDYPRDAGPSISAAAHGDLAGFFAHQPAMGPLSLYLRVPFAAIGVAVHDSPLGIYRWGTLPCLLALALLAVALARYAGRRGTSRLGQILIVAVCLFNPLVNDALYWGHPEEILTASLAAGALIAAAEDKAVLTALLAGLAVASKQWALVVVAPAVLMLTRHRLKAAIGAGVVAVAATLPMVLANFGAFRHALTYISHSQPLVTLFTWLYPFSPPGRVQITDVTGQTHTLIGHRVLPLESALSHPLIVLLGVIIPLLVAVRYRGAARHVRTSELLTATALVLLLRCVIDPECVAYYHLPFLLALLVMDANAGRRLPLAGLLGAAVVYVVLDRFPTYLPASAADLAYIAATATAALILVRSLARAPLPALMRRAAEPITAA